MTGIGLRHSQVVLLVASAFACASHITRAADNDGFTPLFNGKDFTGLKFFVTGAGDPAKTWSVKDGAIVCTGKPAGYFYTEKPYKNYVLQYDWRFPAGSKPESNSGCLVHIKEPHKIWPASVEPQGRYMDHGKLFFPGDNKPIEQKFDPEALKRVLRAMGEWSTTEVTCKPDGSVVVKVNGVEVASGKSALTEGPIGFQSEGAEVHFRNIKLKPLK
jgi:hypothetical protein